MEETGGGGLKEWDRNSSKRAKDRGCKFTLWRSSSFTAASLSAHCSGRETGGAAAERSTGGWKIPPNRKQGQVPQLDWRTGARDQAQGPMGRGTCEEQVDERVLTRRAEKLQSGKS